MNILLIRRAETNKNTGHAGEPEALSPRGEEQMQNLTVTCKDASIEVVVTSTEPRALATAESLSQKLNVPVLQQPDLGERNFGDWSELPWEEIKAKLDALTAEERYTFVPPRGESWQQMETRLQEVLNWTAGQSYKSVAIITHWGPIRALLPIIQEKSRESTLDLQVGNGQCFTLQYQKKNDVGKA